MKLIRSKNKNKLSNEIKKEMRTIPRRNDLLDYNQTQSPAVDLDSNHWKMLIVDDEPDVHEITRIGLKGFAFDGKKLELISAHSAEQARKILQNDRHFAAALIDVVMETEEAGLDLVRFIREEMGLSHIRLIIRTGQPGKAPERFVIDNFDIDDYKEKTDLTTLKMYTMSRSSIKSYRDILTIERRMRVQTGDSSWQGSVSIGVAFRTDDMENFESLIKAADEGVYAAKRAGKNCVKTKKAGSS